MNAEQRAYRALQGEGTAMVLDERVVLAVFLAENPRVVRVLRELDAATAVPGVCCRQEVRARWAAVCAMVGVSWRVNGAAWGPVWDSTTIEPGPRVVMGEVARLVARVPSPSGCPVHGEA